MKTLFNTIIWDLKLQVRNNILTVAVVIAAIYTGVFFLLDLKGNDDVLIILIFTDPAMMGFLFMGVLFLFERSANTLEALVVTPVKIWQYIFSKAISLTLIALIVCFAIVFAGHGFAINYIFFFLASFLTSILFILLGFIGVVQIHTFNQYILIIPSFFTPFSLPLLNFFEITNTYLLYIIPTQASLLLFKASFENIPVFDIIYSIIYLIIWIILAYYFAHKQFIKKIIRRQA